MTDWSGDLSAALASNDPRLMKAALTRVPKEIRQRAVPYLEKMVQWSTAERKLDEALTYYDELIALEPDEIKWYVGHANTCLELDRLPEVIVDAGRILEREPQNDTGLRLRAQASERLRERETALQPDITFDPGLFANPAIPETADAPMRDGLRQLLRRLSAHQAVRNSLARLEDPQWTAAWDTALASAGGDRVLLQGSELGVLAVRARAHGARHIRALETHATNLRIAGGVVQKNLLSAWHNEHAELAKDWSEERRRESFAQFAAGIDITLTGSASPGNEPCTCFAFTDLDHSLLGTGIVSAIRDLRTRGVLDGARVLPARATLYAMPIRWTYPDLFQLEAINALRWSIHPQPLESTDGWEALSAPVELGSLDFENFIDSVRDFDVDITRTGTVDAVIYWFDLDLVGARLSNAPDSPLRCLRPAVRHVDPVSVNPGDHLMLRVTMTATRLHIDTLPASSRPRAHSLPGWYFPMLMDRNRHEAYRAALDESLQHAPAANVLDIGTGCGLLAMMAAHAGASHVFGCEISRAVAALGTDIVRHNGLGDRVTLIPKDSRKLSIPADLPERADLAVFELFDCSLIGEGVLHFLKHARENLLKADARYLPLAGRIHAQVIEFRLERIRDVDVNLLNPYRFSPSFVNVDAASLAHRPLTAPCEVFSFDFSKAEPLTEEKELALPVVASGTAGAVLFWFDLQLSESRWLSNAPGTPAAMHWKQGLQFLPEVRVSPGSNLPLTARHDGSSLTFQWKKDAISQDDVSTLPRLDVRLWQQAGELERQTQDVLRHCTQNPEEYRKVAGLALRFAVDPGAHGIDPVIAQRFAAAFLAG